MYRLLGLTFLISMVLVSCDGRDRAQKTNIEVLKEHKLFNSFSEHVQYTPKEYTEVITDTILSNSFRVEIKTYSDMQTSVLQTVKENVITHKLYFREFISEVSIYKNEKMVFHETIDDSFLAKYIPNIKGLEKSINNGITIEEEKSLDTNSVYLTVSSCVPRTDNCPAYTIIIDEKGHFEIKKTEHAWT